MADLSRRAYSAKVFKKITRKVGTTIRDHGMIGEGDYVLVGLSGGKDSLILLETLAERKKAVPYSFNLSAAHVAAEGIGYHIDREKLESFCRNLEVPLHYRTIEPDLEKDPAKSACFVCSWHRRKALFALTRELGCNRLALGHHRKDAVETLLLNMVYHGSISSLPYSLEMFGGRIRLIRPLMDLDERLLEDYADTGDLVRVERSCPLEDHSKRAQMTGLIDEIEKIHGRGPFNVFRSMDKICREYLPRNKPQQLTRNKTGRDD